MTTITPESKNVYFHLDCESTTLDASTGHMVEVGYVITDGALTTLRYGDYTMFAQPELWDPATLEWAIKTYGPRVVAGSKEFGKNNWPDVVGPLVRNVAAAVQNMEKLGHTVWLVCNHPDFDATLLRAACKLSGHPFPFKYDRILDMASLMMGYGFGYAEGCYTRDERDEAPYPEPKTIKEIYEALGDKKENVAHTALADAERQVGLLRKLGVRLP